MTKIKLMMQFNHGVEIGAHLAYVGHAKRTNDPNIERIAKEEEEHRQILGYELACINVRSSAVIDTFFRCVGTTVGFLCKICPLSWLNFVARSMEIFAIFSYEHLAEAYPARADLFLKMAAVEREHEEYFK